LTLLRPYNWLVILVMHAMWDVLCFCVQVCCWVLIRCLPDTFPACCVWTSELCMLVNGGTASCRWRPSVLPMSAQSEYIMTRSVYVVCSSQQKPLT